MTKVIFMGTPAFSVPILEGLLAENYEVVAVVTQPDRPVGRKKIMTPPPVKSCALAHQLPIFQPEKISGSPEMEQLMTMDADVIVTAAFGQFLPEALLQKPTFGAVNVHASLLPKYRGGAPVHYALMQGETQTGVTIMQMVKKMDAGAIFAQKAIEITPQDDVGTLFERLSLLGRDLLLQTLPSILDGTLTPTPQNEAEVTFSPNITSEQERIDWHKTATEIDNQVRGMRPWPIAFTTYQRQTWKIWAAQPLTAQTNEAPGTIVKRSKKELWVACGEQTVLAITRLQPAGKKELAIQDFLNGVGRSVAQGDKVE